MRVEPTAHYIAFQEKNIQWKNQANVLIDPTIWEYLEYMHMIKGLKNPYGKIHFQMKPEI